MSDLLSSRWAPGASGAYSSPELRRPKSENRISTNTQNPRARFPPTGPRSGPSSSPTRGGHTRSEGPLSPAEELSRFLKIIARLRWKLPFLAQGYRQAIQQPDEMNADSASEVAQAEIMFKLDFHEYYALLERAIVHLLAVFNISVSAVGPRGGKGGVQVYGGGYHSAGMHRYHANVLQALQEETTPLTPVLGSGYVHELLRQAKELRNRWKTADMTKEEREQDPFEARRSIAQLASFNFDAIFNGIFQGLEEAYARAEAHVNLCKRPGDTDGDDLDSAADWGFMVDAMDWEAV